MEVREALQKRRSIRKYTEDAVSKEQLDELLHAAMSGPSACNRTPWDFYVVTDPEVLKKLREAAKFSKITAPAAIVVCGNLSKALPMQYASYWIQDCSAATENILLAATELGLGTVWVCYFKPDVLRKEFTLPDNLEPINILVIGYSDEEPADRNRFEAQRIAMSELVSYENL